MPWDDGGWSGPSMPPDHLSRQDYLNQLAEVAEEWYRIDREGVLSLSRRLSQLRTGCSVLILARHRPLSSDDQQCLIESARTWAARCDGDLIALETGTEPRIIRGQVDRLIDEAASVLRKRARHSSDSIKPKDRPPAC